MKRTLALLAVILLLSFSQRAFAACAPGSNWTAVWTDSLGQTTYTLEAPCKVYIGIPFSITATVTDATCPNNDVGFGWAIKDNGAVILGGGFNWITTVGGQWQQVYQQTYTGTPIDHLIEFAFTDTGDGGSAHWWAANLMGAVTVDPYPNTAPVVDAGPDLLIESKDQDTTVIQGAASDADGNPLSYRWLEGNAELQASQPVDASGGAPLNLGAIPRLAPGSHTFTLEVSDGTALTTDTVVVSVENSQPLAAPFAGGTFQAGDAIRLQGSVSDYDGDTLSYRWLEGTTVIAQGTVAALSGGAPVQLPEHTLAGGLPVGSHSLVLELNDGINTVTASTIVTVIDTKAPTLAPMASTYLLWPPNGKMTEVRISANARDNSGGPVILSVLVTTNGGMHRRGKGWKASLPDYSIVGIDQLTGTIVLQLRHAQGKQELSYAIIITATDASANSSKTEMVIKSAHRQQRSRRF